jgi:regulation of enolase protein 1 (concanavalin A-like superfamily)
MKILLYSLCFASAAMALAPGAAAQKPIDPPVPTGFPAAALWRHNPLAASIKDGVLTITAGPKSNWTLLFPVTAPDFVFSARLSHDFASQWDAGALVVYVDETHWIKFCFEKNITGKPMVVSVVTRNKSDDVNHFFVDKHEIWMKIAKMGTTYFLYASSDGHDWLLLRDFTLGTDYKPEQIHFGFLAQSPEGQSKTVVYDHILYQTKRITNVFTGE